MPELKPFLAFFLLFLLIGLFASGCSDVPTDDDVTSPSSIPSPTAEPSATPLETPTAEPDSPSPVPEFTPTPAEPSATPGSTPVPEATPMPAGPTATPEGTPVPDATPTPTPPEPSASPETPTPVPQDLDGDGFTVDGGDCDDADPTRNPGATEVPYDDIDQDCDGVDLTDVDGDGYDAEEAGLPGPGPFDCDDLDPYIYPGAPEIADGKDNDCDDDIDEDLSTTDDDGDGFAESDRDCNDYDAQVYPGAVEIPYDGVDQDCDGFDLEDVDQDGFKAEEVGGMDCNDLEASVNPDAVEVPYDGVDQDCDGADLVDVDGDGYPSEAAGGDDCDDTDPTIYPGRAEEAYDGVDQDCDGADLTDVDQDGFDASQVGGPDCDDSEPAVNPDATEIPYDGADQDCIGGDLVDVDGDGFDATVAGGTDCNDDEATIHPGALEVCDGIDQDCNGEVDDAAVDAGTFYPDVDQDGFGDADLAYNVCTPEEGWIETGDDCDDADATVNPAAEEVCNSIDDNCNGEIDEGLLLTFYADTDGDGFGDPNSTLHACSVPPGFVSNMFDCNDGDASINPDASEGCDGADNDCDGIADEGYTCIGCADGEREGFIDLEAYPDIASCAAAWDQAGLLADTTYAPACGRGSGDDSENPNGTGCTVADACAEGWHVCVTVQEVDFLTGGSCGAAGSGFFATRTSGPGCGVCASGTVPGCNGSSCAANCAQNQDTANDLFGCGDLGASPDGNTCGVLNRFSNNTCGSLGSPWECGSLGGYDEAHAVVKRDSTKGGVLCCRD